jgi:hypothetical protein
MRDFRKARRPHARRLAFVEAVAQTAAASVLSGRLMLHVPDARKQAKAEASAEVEQAARSTSAGRTVERDPVVAALIERLERRADTEEGRRS